MRAMLVVAMLIVCIFLSSSNCEKKRYIHYPAIHHGGDGGAGGCNPNYPLSCGPKAPSQPYSRGCTTATRSQRPHRIMAPRI
ncbi:unnamed protein product [Thlaspi arvense]|uniref:Uncharacterized protein n=1 Tax=Thlaspi arvense TaxID=13288 RepID=A0AAU9ST83_THLAR|nr:unnamed protein product [Thlaspi arvense]